VVVFDTNVLVSAALIQGSRADRCVRAVPEHQHPLIFSKATFEELSDVLLRSKLDRYVSKAARRSLLETWENAAVFFPDAALQEVVHDCRDPEDNKFLELALASRAAVIVTGDPDLLRLDPWRGIRIVKLADFDSVVIPILEKEDLG
jgi:putative PIN family toxin of toxin-antitoxin system